MKIKEIMENYKVTQSSPQGIELTAQDGVKLTLPPEKMTAIHQLDPSDPNKLSLDPNAMTQTSSTDQQQVGPKVGAEVELPSDLSSQLSTTMGETSDEEQADLVDNGNNDVGGDRTDKLINKIVDRAYERAARGSNISSTGGNSRDVLPENDELNRWLTIANLR
jgi:hypothetical protein